MRNERIYTMDDDGREPTIGIEVRADLDRVPAPV